MGDDLRLWVVNTIRRPSRVKLGGRWRPHNARLSSGLLYAGAWGRGLLDLVYPPQYPGCSAVGELFCEVPILVRTLSDRNLSPLRRRAGLRGLCAACAARQRGSTASSLPPSTPIPCGKQFRATGTRTCAIWPARSLSGWLPPGMRTTSQRMSSCRCPCTPGLRPSVAITRPRSWRADCSARSRCRTCRGS